MDSKYPEILTLKQAAEFLQISDRTLQRIVKTGEVPGVQVGGQWRFDLAQLRAVVRGEWSPIQKEETGRTLVEKESLRLGVEIPEALHDLQQAAARRLSNRGKADEDN